MVDLIAVGRKRSRASGLTRINQVLRAAVPNPANGGALGYSVPHRRESIALFNNGLPHSASDRSIRRWRNEHIDPFIMTGNSSNLQFSGQAQYLLLMYLLVFPKSSADEKRRFIFENMTVNPTIFSQTDIYEAENRLGLTSKRSSTTAFQFSTPQNLIRRHLYWTVAYPVGVSGIPRQFLIDLDEAAITGTLCNRTVGKSMRGLRVRESGVYSQGVKHTLQLAVGANGFKHLRLTDEAGTSFL